MSMIKKREIGVFDVLKKNLLVYQKLKIIRGFGEAKCFVRVQPYIYLKYNYVPIFYDTPNIFTLFLKSNTKKVHFC